MSLPLVVLAAGLSTRYGRLKQLERLGPGGEAIMDYNVFDALRAGFDEIVYVVRPEILDPLREHVRSVFGDGLNARYVLQELDDLPEGFQAPPDRRKPWGTAHAVLCAARALDGPLVVCNSDDLYGPASFKRLHEYMAEDPAPTDAVLIGYPLRETLAGGGGVARGLCHVGREGFLEHVIEVRDIRRAEAWIVGIEDMGSEVDLTGDELVSMNLWGLGPAAVRGIRRQFRSFLTRWGAHPGKEFFLSSAVNESIQTYGARVKVLVSEDAWMGITYEQDREHFRSRLESRLEAGVYPGRLAPPVAGGA